MREETGQAWRTAFLPGAVWAGTAVAAAAVLGSVAAIFVLALGGIVVLALLFRVTADRDADRARIVDLETAVHALDRRLATGDPGPLKAELRALTSEVAALSARPAARSSPEDPIPLPAPEATTPSTADNAPSPARTRAGFSQGGQRQDGAAGAGTGAREDAKAASDGADEATGRAAAAADAPRATVSAGGAETPDGAPLADALMPDPARSATSNPAARNLPVASPTAEGGPEPLPPVGEQPELPMLAPPGHVALSTPQIVRALNFPADAEDTQGFDLLRRALARRDLAELLQAAEDCLNFLAQERLYMDDLLMAPATAEDWRRFAKGGQARAALMPIQGIRDEAATLAVQARMRADPVFRDSALVFQRRFDAFLAGFAPAASDREVLDLIDSRSGRAFVLFAQISGALD